MASCVRAVLFHRACAAQPLPFHERTLGDALGPEIGSLNPQWNYDTLVGFSRKTQ